MDPTAPRRRQVPSLPLALGYGLLAGAALGALEALARVAGNTDPSIARRVPQVLAYAATWYGLAGALVSLVAALVLRVGRALGWRTAREGPQALTLGTVVAALLPTAVVLTLGTALQARPGTMRLMLLALVALLSLLVAWVVARHLAARPWRRGSEAVHRLWAPRAVLALLWLVALGGALILWEPQRALGSRRAATAAVAGERPNVLLALVDTLRADALGCYGAPEPTPTIDALARRGVRFERALAPSSWTLPSVASLFTGAPPWKHGCTNFALRVREMETLADAFAAQGYECLAAVGNPFVSEGAGYARGFHVFDVDSQAVQASLFVSRFFDRMLRLAGLRHDAQRILPWIDTSSLPLVTTRLGSYLMDEDLVENARRFAWPGGERPYFLYVQLLAPHTPYLAHPMGFLKRGAKLVEGNLDVVRDRYLQEVRYCDEQLGRLLGALDEDGLMENTLVVVTSDHGEEFLEHGDWEHGRGLYDEVVAVPLVVAGPGVSQGAVLGGTVGLLDVGPTLLELADAEVPESFTGRSRAAALRGDGSVESEPLFAETGPSFLTPGHRYLSVTHGRYRLIRRVALEDGSVVEEAYDLATDPGEQRPLEGADEALDALRSRLDEYAAIERDAEGGGELLHDPTDIRALGYAGESEEEEKEPE